MQFYNQHSHIFTQDDTPKGFLKLYLGDFWGRYLEKPIKALASSETGIGVFTQAIKVLSFLRLTNAGVQRYVDFLKVGGMATQLDVLLQLAGEHNQDPDMKFVALTLNMEHLGISGPGNDPTYGTQLLRSVEAKKAFGDKLLLFYCIDPRAAKNGATLLEQVKKAFNTPIYPKNPHEGVFPYTGLKLYPATGFFVYDERLKETFDWAYENEIPLLTHCNFMGGIFNNSETEIQSAYYTLNGFDPVWEQPGIGANANQYKFQKGKKDQNQKSCSYFLEPASYIPVLDYYKNKGIADGSGKGLKMCFAHFGGYEQMKNDPEIIGIGAATMVNKGGGNWTEQIRFILKNYPGTTADISYTVSKGLKDRSIFDIFLAEARNPVYGNRILYGTDYYMTEKEGSQNAYYSAFREFAVRNKGLQPGKNLWQEIAGSNTEAWLTNTYWHA